MSYSKEYYELHKEKMRLNQKRWRDKNKEEVNKKQREKRASLTQEEIDEINRKAREKRQEQGDLARQKYREYYYKNQSKINKARRERRKMININNKGE